MGVTRTDEERDYDAQMADWIRHYTVGFEGEAETWLDEERVRARATIAVLGMLADHVERGDHRL